MLVIVLANRLCTVGSFAMSIRSSMYIVTCVSLFMYITTLLFHQTNHYSIWKQSHLVSPCAIPIVNHQLTVCIDFYHQHRMLLGVAEGVSELVPEKALPFEFNLDYMNGGTYVCMYTY